jgi:hypothetical protein
MKGIFLVLLFISYISFGQTPDVKLPSVLGPSPDVASMQKYGDYKVSTYTGVPGITLPIYTLQANDISVPISISYHGGGIKVDEESSRVGLGWSLNAGGTISRNILGLDDLSAYSFAPNSFNLYGFPERPVINTLHLPFGSYTYDISDKVGVIVDPTMQFVDLDLEPDIFYCNFLGNSDKFLLNKSDTSGVFEDSTSNMKVKLTITPYNVEDTTIASAVKMNCTIRITTNDGTNYYFDQFESCTTVSPNSDIPNRITAWYLTKIQTIKGTVVNFNYTQTASGFTYSLNHPYTSKNLFPATGQPSEPVTSYIPHNLYRNLLLSSITSPNCNVYFTYDTRIDLNGDKKLTSVKVTDGKGLVVKTVNLIQDYFTANSSTANTYDVQAALWGGPTLDNNWLTKRLKLTELQEVSSDNKTTLSHKFIYNESLLPVKNSTSRDHWGYFNNADNGANLIPDLYWAYPGLAITYPGGVYNCVSTSNDFGSSNILYMETSHKFYEHYTGANREVDTNYSKAFMLNEIIYPTGGSTKFDFEQNTYDKAKSFANDDHAALYDYISKTDSVAFLVGIPGIPSGYSQSYNFSITAADTLPGEGFARVNFSITGLRAGGNSSSSTTHTTIALLDNSGVLVDQTGFNDYTGLFTNPDGSYSPNPLNEQLAIGNYTIKITVGGNVVDKNSPYYAVVRNWWVKKDQNTDGIMYKYAGGLRIRNISSYTSAGNLATSINYTYHYTADINQKGIPEIYSTGKIMERPNYFDATMAVAPIQVYLKSESDANVNIGYDSVLIEQNRIRHLEVYNNTCYRPNPFKTYYTTSNPGNEMMPVGVGNLPSFSFPNEGLPGNLLYLDVLFDYIPQGVKSFFDNANGKLTKSVDYLYDSISGNYKVLKQTENTYTYKGTGIGGIVWADRIFASSGPYDACLKGLPEMYGVTNYFYPALRTAAVLPLQSTEKNYSGNDSLITTTNYAYTLYNQLSKKTVTNSKGETIITAYSYPLDYLASTGTDAWSKEMAALRSKNILTPIVEQYVQKKSPSGSLIGTIHSTLTSYKNTNNLPDSVWATEYSHPSTSFTPLSTSGGSLVKDNTYVPQLTYNKYDIAGNIVEQQLVHGKKNVYLWDYSNSSPICQVLNGDSASVAYTSFEADGSGNWLVGTGTIDTTTAITGSRSYSKSSDISKSGLNSTTTYIVSYWTRNNSPFTITGTISGYPVKGKTIAYNNISWTLYTHRVTGQSTITLSGSGPIDELRLYPVGAQMTTYTYTPLVGMTSQTDMGNRVTYYEYDGLQRLMRIRDQDHNILKSLEYQYQVSSGCGPNCYSITMQTLAGTNTLGYPVGVFDIHGNLLGNATGPVQYVSLWNADTADARIGTLSTGSDSLHFSMTLNTGMTLPTGVTGCRYYQVDLAWNQFDGVRNINGTYVDFGDGTGMHLPKNVADTAASLAPGTVFTSVNSFQFNGPTVYYMHTYTDTSQKTLTFYHNDAAEDEDFDNVFGPATGLTLVKNLRGTLPQHTYIFGGSSYQQATMNSVANIANWNTISSIQYFRLNDGDGLNPAMHISYTQDFMKNNKGLLSIKTSNGYYAHGYVDTSFTISRLKSDWNTWFTSLQQLQINDDHWNREDLSALTHLNFVQVWASPQNHQDDHSSPLVPIPSSVIDNIINQIAAGAGQTVNNGSIDVESGGPSRTSASDAAVSLLKSRGWVVAVNGVLQ